MSEIYKNSTSYAYLDIYGDVADTQPTATLRVSGVTYDENNPAPTLPVQGPESVDGAERWSAVVGFAYTQDAGQVSVTWEFTIDGVGATKVDYFNVVVPLVDINTARDELEIPEEISDDKIVLAERRVRRLIERITGQVFAPVEETLSATQYADGSLRLPQRIISVTSVNGVGNTLYYTIGGDGWFLNIIYPLKRDGIRASGVPIRYPWPSGDTRPQKALVTGVWGYETVPPAIEEAALILIEQQLCPEAIYAERYLKTMTAADFRFEFDKGAYAGTGNVIADQLLAKFSNRAPAVI